VKWSHGLWCWSDGILLRDARDLIFPFSMSVSLSAFPLFLPELMNWGKAIWGLRQGQLYVCQRARIRSQTFYHIDLQLPASKTVKHTILLCKPQSVAFVLAAQITKIKIPSTFSYMQKIWDKLDAVACTCQPGY
jgi:hypothetical protein